MQTTTDPETLEEATSSVAPLVAHGRSPDGAAGAFLAELFEQHSKMVLGLCRLLLRDRVEAEDAMQQTFLSAYSSILHGGGPREPAAWLATIARNECRARVRARMREPLAEPGAGVEAVAPDALTAAIANADLQALARAIKKLPRQQREALLLREFSGLSYSELASALGVSKPAVESLLFRARRGLRTATAGVYAAIPLPVALRDALDRLLGDGTAGPLAKLVAMPAIAKLTAGTVAVAVVGTGALAVGHEMTTPHKARSVWAPVHLAVASAARPAAAKPVYFRTPARTKRWSRVTKPTFLHAVAHGPVAGAPVAPSPQPIPVQNPPVQPAAPSPPPVQSTLPAVTGPEPSPGTTSDDPNGGSPTGQVDGQSNAAANGNSKPEGDGGPAGSTGTASDKSTESTSGSGDGQTSPSGSGGDSGQSSPEQSSPEPSGSGDGGAAPTTSSPDGGGSGG